MIAIALQSGSQGNCIYVESDGEGILFDAGISGIRAEQRLAAHGRDIRQVKALIISHDHADHVKCAGIYQRKFGLPLHMTPKTHKASASQLGRVNDVRHFKPGAKLRIGRMTVETISTPHDAVDGLAFVVTAKRKRLGILTDLGHSFDGLDRVVKSLDAVFLESNYDPKMLENGPYPFFLKERIRSPHGHLSNVESAELLCRAAAKRLQWVCLAHLSENNNTPMVALRTHRKLAGNGHAFHAAKYREATRLLEVAG